MWNDPVIEQELNMMAEQRCLEILIELRDNQVPEGGEYIFYWNGVYDNKDVRGLVKKRLIKLGFRILAHEEGVWMKIFKPTPEFEDLYILAS